MLRQRWVAHSALRGSCRRGAGPVYHIRLCLSLATFVVFVGNQTADCIRCWESVCTVDGSTPGSQASQRCLQPLAFTNRERDCAPGFDRCQRWHVFDPTGLKIPPEGVWYYRCAKGTDLQTGTQYFCPSAGIGNLTARGTEFRRTPVARFATYRYYCCRNDAHVGWVSGDGGGGSGQQAALACNNPTMDRPGEAAEPGVLQCPAPVLSECPGSWSPAVDSHWDESTLGVPMQLGVIGWTYTQAQSWSHKTDCAGAITSTDVAPLFTLQPPALGTCMAVPGQVELQRWLGVQAGTAPQHEWGSSCVACDIRAGRIGEAVTTHIFYSSGNCDWASGTFVVEYPEPGVCARDSERDVSYVSYCDTQSSCPRPPLDGLIVTQMSSATCPQANRRFYIAVSASDLGRCIQRGVVSTSILYSVESVFGGVPGDALGATICSCLFACRPPRLACCRPLI